MIWASCQDQRSAEIYEQLKKGVGNSIGTIRMEILEVIVAEHPDLDDL